MPNPEQISIFTKVEVHGNNESQWLIIAKQIKRNKSAVLGGSIILFLMVIAVFAPILSSYDPVEQNLDIRLQPPSKEHWMGTDQFGRDIAVRIFYGSRITISIGFIVVALSSTIGCLIGITSGYYGGLYDLFFQRIIDIMMTLPGLLLAFSIVAVLGPGLNNTLIALIISWTPSFVRVVRGSTMATREENYIMASRSLGASDARILFRHILPNIISPFIVMITLTLGGAILDAAALGFLGLGAQPPSPEWGAMLARARDYLQQTPWMSIAPGVAISLVVVGFNLLGDGFRDVLDPRWTR